ncbi:acylphosphatase-2 isoform X3 [Mirounga leonina]|uniref:acylphosphatase-2 isoform X3 n=1 Tax=Mirounga leonina TaxID=9715 RepID=UPI00156C392F|nr:acylphosphatase-2 isoform X3 [Mirounga leonina]XP_045740950.1 acylphosphatase-2 isoform X3 [Mirounga angustirostris]
MCPLPLLAAAVAASRTPRRLLGRGLAAAMSAAGRLKSVDYEVFGRVQGVCFRMYTEGEAKKIGVVGWVKNTSKGTVTGQVQGPEEKVNSISLQHTFLLVPLTYCSCDQLLQHMIWKVRVLCFSVRWSVRCGHKKRQSSFRYFSFIILQLLKTEGHGENTSMVRREQREG